MSAEKQALEENSEFWTIPAQGYVAQMISIDFAVKLILASADENDDHAWVSIETPFTYTDCEGQSAVHDPQGIRRELGPVLDCFNRTVERVLVWKPDARLDLGFTDGCRIEVVADEKYEAWDVTGPGSLKFVCTPGGGEPAIWY